MRFSPHIAEFLKTLIRAIPILTVFMKSYLVGACILAFLFLRFMSTRLFVTEGEVIFKRGWLFLSEHKITALSGFGFSVGLTDRILGSASVCFFTEGKGTPQKIKLRRCDAEKCALILFGKGVKNKRKVPFIRSALFALSRGITYSGLIVFAGAVREGIGLLETANIGGVLPIDKSKIIGIVIVFLPAAVILVLFLSFLFFLERYLGFRVSEGINFLKTERGFIKRTVNYAGKLSGVIFEEPLFLNVLSRQSKGIINNVEKPFFAVSPAEKKISERKSRNGANSRAARFNIFISALFFLLFCISFKKIPYAFILRIFFGVMSCSFMLKAAVGYETAHLNRIEVSDKFKITGLNRTSLVSAEIDKDCISAVTGGSNRFDRLLGTQTVKIFLSHGFPRSFRAKYLKKEDREWI